MGTLYALSLGPIPTGTGEGLIFMGMLDGRLVPSEVTTDADAALAAMRRQVPAGTRLQCLPELASAGVKHGYAPTPPSDEALAVRAQLAFVLAHPHLQPRASGELFPLMQAAAAFWAARAWDRLPGDVPIEVSVTGAVRATFEAAVMGAGGEEFGLALYPRPGSIAKIAAAVDAGRPQVAAQVDSVSLTYEDDPAFAVRAIEAWCGLPRVPVAFGLRRGRPRPIEPEDALALAATLHAMSKMKGEPGETVVHTLSGPDVEVVVTVRLPGGVGTPQPRPPARRARR